METETRAVIADWGAGCEARSKVLAKKPGAYLNASANADSYTGIVFQVVLEDVYGEVEGAQGFVSLVGSDFYDNALNAWEDALSKLEDGCTS
jgi:hypothetical protein